MRRAHEGRSAAVRNRSLRVRGRVCSGLFFFPRGGSAQVARALAGSLPETGWQMTLATGSLGKPGDPTHAGSFYAGIDIAAVDYSPALQLADPLAAPVPFQPSYEDRPAGPDRVFAAVDEAADERLVAAWAEALARARASDADVLHLHHLTPAHEAALRAFSSLPIVGQLHGTELAFCARSRPGHARAGATHTRANGQPAFGLYVLDEPTGVFRAVGLIVVTLAADRIGELTRFEAGVLPQFGLPRSLPY